MSVGPPGSVNDTDSDSSGSGTGVFPALPGDHKGLNLGSFCITVSALPNQPSLKFYALNVLQLPALGREGQLSHHIQLNAGMLEYSVTGLLLMQIMVYHSAFQPVEL